MISNSTSNYADLYSSTATRSDNEAHDSDTSSTWCRRSRAARVVYYDYYLARTVNDGDIKPLKIPKTIPPTPYYHHLIFRIIILRLVVATIALRMLFSRSGWIHPRGRRRKK